MKKFLLAVTAAAAMVAAVSCNKTPEFIQTEAFTYEQSTDHAAYSFYYELPVGKDKVSSAIRDAVLEYIAPGLKGSNPDSLSSVFDDFGPKAFSAFAEGSDDVDNNGKSIFGDDANFPAWEGKDSISVLTETEKVIVFSAYNYEFTGGAHGLYQSNALVFNKKNGAQVEAIIAPDKLTDLQDAMKKGLLEYYASCGETLTEAELMDELQIDGFIPMPSAAPYPSADGIVFVYQPYEIAPYCDGAPTFTISFEDVMPYLTEEAKSLFSE